MFIFWGRKIVRRKLGYVADFCGICRAASEFELQRIGSVGHVYYLSFGEGALVGYERKCTGCGTSSAADANRYARISPATLALEQLKRSTFPGLDEAIQERMALEERIRTSPHMLTRAEREALIRNPFLLLSPKVEKRFSSTHIDLGVGLALLGAIAVLCAAPVMASAVGQDAEGKIFLVAIAIGTALVIWQSLESGPRYMRKEILPVLAKSLKPLQPSEAEIGQALEELKKAGHKIGKKLKPAHVVQETGATVSA